MADPTAFISEGHCIKSSGLFGSSTLPLLARFVRGTPYIYNIYSLPSADPLVHGLVCILFRATRIDAYRLQDMYPIVYKDVVNIVVESQHISIRNLVYALYMHIY